MRNQIEPSEVILEFAQVGAPDPAQRDGAEDLTAVVIYGRRARATQPRAGPSCS